MNRRRGTGTGRNPVRGGLLCASLLLLGLLGGCARPDSKPASSTPPTEPSAPQEAAVAPPKPDQQAAPTPDIPCDMPPAFTATDATQPGGVPVLGDKFALLFTAPLNVNTDGTSRSYSLDDPEGEAFALNRLCHAMEGACRGLDEPARAARYAKLREARERDWAESLVRDTSLSAAVIARAPDGRICPEVPVIGQAFLISAIALADPRIAGVCGLDSYADALAVPMLFLQGGENGFRQRGVRVGDAVVAWRDGMERPVLGIIGDTAPANRIAEGSIALNGALLGRESEPANYRETIRRYAVPRATVLIFPATRDAGRPRITAERVEDAARAALLAWDGGSEEKATARLRACAARAAR